MKRRVQLDRRPCTDFAWLPSSSSSTTSAMLEHAMDQVEVLRRFESTTYQRRDYLNGPGSPYTTSIAMESDPQQQQYYRHPSINETTRQAMVELLYDVGDYCQFRRDTIAYAVWNLMDRYLSSPQHTPLQTVADFQLVASTALHIAVKVLEPVSMDVQSLADLSHGAFQGKDIVRMEQTMLLTLEWNIAHGPTPIQFVQLYLTILQQLQLQKGDSSSSPKELWDILFDHAQYQVELAVMDYKVAIHKLPSDIALAAVWNALECHLACDEDEDMTTLQQWQHQLVQQLAKRLEPSHGGSFLDRLHKLPQIQLRLCKLQYTAELSCRLRAQEENQQLQQEQSQLVESSSTQHPPRPPTEVDVNEYHDDVCHNETATTEVTEPDEGSENQDDAVLLGVVHQESKVFVPSPVSVTTNHMSADYNNNNATTKMEAQTTETRTSSEAKWKTQESTLYGLSFLRRLFFS